MRCVCLVVVLLTVLGVSRADEQRRLKRTLHDDLVADGWIYEDLEAGYAKARESGRPLLVSLRCVP